MLAGMVTVITLMALPQVQDTTTHKDTVPPPVAPAEPTIEQIHYMDGLKTVTRGVENSMRSCAPSWCVRPNR